jgi:phosphohistidine swiveling domain-containing protein
MYLLSLNKNIAVEEFGGKGAQLSRMMRAGFPIPDGFVISTRAFERFEKENFSIEEIRNDIQSELNRIGASHYMVRSSAIGEDSDENSFAGQLDSFLCGNDIDEILQHIKKCWKSYEKENVKTYEAISNKRLEGMGVVVQALIDPDYAGVIFTRSYLESNAVLVEYVQGHGEKLVSGEVTPMRFHYRYGEGSRDAEFLPALEEGMHVAKNIESHYGMPMDIEWALKDGKFYVVQARKITTAWKEPEVYWSNTNVNENYPEAISPLLYSIARQSYYHYFKNLSRLFQVSEESIRALEGSFTNVIGVFGGKMFYNMSSIHAILSASPFSEALIQSFDNFVGYAEGAKASKIPSTNNEKFAFVRNVLKQNKALPQNVVEFERIVSNYMSDVQGAITHSDIRNLFHGFIEIRMHSWYRASLADFFAMAFHGLLGKLCVKYYGDGGVGIQNKLIQAIPNLISSRPVIDMHELVLSIRKNEVVYTKFQEGNALDFWIWLNSEFAESAVCKGIHDYLNNWGFRCSGELMLTFKNYIEEPERFIALLMQYEKLPDQNPEEVMHTKYLEALQAKRDFKKYIFKKNKLNLLKSIFHVWQLNFLVKNACKGISSRERVRLKQAQLYFGFKLALKKVEQSFLQRNILKSEGEIFFLNYTEIAEHLDASQMASAASIEILESRKQAFEVESKLIYPDDFYTTFGKYCSPDQVTRKEVSTDSSSDLKGLCACGGVLTGRVKVLETVMEADKLEKGDILVTRQTDPGWVSVFPLISGLIVERGGMLSHGAIVSREFGIPAIVGVELATLKLKDGDLITLNADKGTIVIHD